MQIKFRNVSFLFSNTLDHWDHFFFILNREHRSWKPKLVWRGHDPDFSSKGGCRSRSGRRRSSVPRLYQKGLVERRNFILQNRQSIEWVNTIINFSMFSCLLSSHFAIMQKLESTTNSLPSRIYTSTDLLPSLWLLTLTPIFKFRVISI